MFEKQYKETFSQVVASDSLMQEVLNLKNKRHKKIRMMTLLAAVMLIFALATTAFAYTGFVVYDNPGQMLEAFFGKGKETPNHSDAYISQREELNEEAAEEYVAPYIFEVGQSITHNGNTLTVDAATYDPYTQCGVVYMRLENPNGVPSYTVGMDGQYAPDGPFIIRSNIPGYYFFVDQEQTTNTSLVLACYLNKGDYMKDAILKLHLEEDTQEITIPLEATETMEHITLGNGGIQLSPIGLVIHGDKLGLMRGTETHVNSAIIRYADGSEYLVEDDTGDVPVINYAGAMLEPGDGYTTNRRCVTYLLNRVVPLKDVTEVIVDGVSYSVDTEPIDMEVISSVPEKQVRENKGSLQDIWSVANTTGPTLELTEGTVSGHLLYTLTEVQIYDRVPIINQTWTQDDFDNPAAPFYHWSVYQTSTGNWVDNRFPIEESSVENGMMEGASVQVLENGQWVEYAWADIKNEDGSLKHGVRLILIDVIIEGKDAIAPDEIDYSIESTYGYKRGTYEFFIDRLLLADASVTDAQGLHPTKDTDFYSWYWEDRSNWVYDSEDFSPGLRQYYTFGFLIGANQQDEKSMDLSNLYICAEEDTMQTNLIPLTSIK